MSQLNQITTGTYATMLGNIRTNATIDKCCQKFHQFRVNATLTLRKRTHACEHARAYKKIIQRLTHTGSMRANDIILQVAQVLIAHAPLGHWTKTGIDTIDDLVARKLLQKTITILHAG